MYLPPRKQEPQQPDPTAQPSPSLTPEELRPSTEETLPVLKPLVVRSVPARKQASPARKRRVTCCLLVAVLFLIPVVFYVAEYLRCIEFTPSGDRLFDLYAQEVIDRQALRLFVWVKDGPNPVMLPDEVLAGWERNFGDDPRYWQLRYCCTADIPADIVAEYEAIGLRPEVYYLEVAREEGHADAATLWALWAAYRGVWIEEYLLELSYLEPRQDRPDEFTLERVLMERHGDEIIALLDEMVAADPDLSWPYYRRARQHYVMGDNDATLADLRRGNEASENSYPEPFPYNVASDAVNDGWPIANRTILGGVLVLHIAEPVVNYRAWFKFGEEVTSADHRNYCKWLAEYYRFACRFGAMDGVDKFHRMVGIDLAGKAIEETLVNRTDQLTPDERWAMLKLHKIKCSAHGKFVLQNDKLDQLIDENWRFDPFVGFFGNYINTSCIMLADDYWSAGQYIMDVDGMLAGVLDELAQFDYITMSWPEDETSEDNQQDEAAPE